MQNRLLTSLVVLALWMIPSTGANAEFFPTMYPTFDQKIVMEGPRVITPTDPDLTGYPMINNWKDSLERTVTVFLNNTERANLTQARVDNSNSLLPVFTRCENDLRALLTPEQHIILGSIFATVDMEKVCAMATDDDQWNAYSTSLGHRLHCSGTQESALSSSLQTLRDDIRALFAQYAARFDQQIASAESRVLAERTERLRLLGLPPEDNK